MIIIRYQQLIIKYFHNHTTAISETLPNVSIDLEMNNNVRFSFILALFSFIDLATWLTKSSV